MNIAFIGQKGIPVKFGGVESHVEHLAIGLAKKGHTVFAYTRPWYTPKNKKTYKGINLVSLPSLRTKHFDAISHTFMASIDALKKDYDVVHYHGVGPALLSWIPRVFKPKTKVVVTFHCIDRYHQKWGVLARLALHIGEWAAVRFAHDTITVSKVLQMYCANNYNADTVHVPNGVNLHKPIGASLIKKKFGLKKDNYIIFLSRLVKHKGPHYLIEAYKKLKTDKKLVIAGGSAFTDDYVKQLKQMAKGNKNIIFTGNVQGDSQLWAELYSNAYLFVHPSESEGLPIVVLEAMSFGTPVLVSDIAENLEAISVDYGLYFASRDVDDLKKKIQYALKYPEKIKVIGEKAKVMVKNCYAWKDIVADTEKVYEDLVDVELVRPQNVVSKQKAK